MHDRLIDVPTLRRILADAGMTMADLHRASGVSYSLIKYVLAGQRQFSDVNAVKVARVLGCRPEDFSSPKPHRAAA